MACAPYVAHEDQSVVILLPCRSVGRHKLGVKRNGRDQVLGVDSIIDTPATTAPPTRSDDSITARHQSQHHRWHQHTLPLTESQVSGLILPLADHVAVCTEPASGSGRLNPYHHAGLRFSILADQGGQTCSPARVQPGPACHVRPAQHEHTRTRHPTILRLCPPP